MRSSIPLLLLSALIIAGCSRSEPAKKSDTATYADTMHREHRSDKPTGNEVAWMQPAQPVVGEDVAYDAGDPATRGYVARPATGDSGLPGIIVIHEWWGLNDNIRAMTRRLAGDGYRALAVDLYGGAVATTPDSAKTLTSKAMADMEPGKRTLRAAISYLKSKGAGRIGVIGWCFGGGWSLQTALDNPRDIDATVIYYGKLETDPAKLRALDMPVLGMFGGRDASIPVEQVRAFEAGMKTAGVNGEVHVYDSAGHAFANPSGQMYSPDAATDAWKRTQAFLTRYLSVGEK